MFSGSPRNPRLVQRRTSFACRRPCHNRSPRNWCYSRFCTVHHQRVDNGISTSEPSEILSQALISTTIRIASVKRHLLRKIFFRKVEEAWPSRIEHCLVVAGKDRRASYTVRTRTNELGKIIFLTSQDAVGATVWLRIKSCPIRIEVACVRCPITNSSSSGENISIKII